MNQPVPCCDSHVHLQAEEFTGQLREVMEAARNANVTRFVCNGSNEQDWPSVTRLAAEESGVIPCYGLHPWYVAQRSSNWETALCSHLGRVPSGVGEIGLDRWIEPRDEADQEGIFRAQLEIARELRRPFMLHCLRAWGWMRRVLEDEAPFPSGFLIHAFSGPVEMIPAFAKLGAYFSFGGSLLDPRKRKAREAAQAAPEDRLLVESDAPDFVLPETLRPFDRRSPEGKPINEPAVLPTIVRGLAELRQVEDHRLAAILWANSEQFLAPILTTRAQVCGNS